MKQRRTSNRQRRQRKQAMENLFLVTGYVVLAGMSWGLATLAFLTFSA